MVSIILTMGMFCQQLWEQTLIICEGMYLCPNYNTYNISRPCYKLVKELTDQRIYHSSATRSRGLYPIIFSWPFFSYHLKHDNGLLQEFDNMNLFDQSVLLHRPFLYNLHIYKRYLTWLNLTESAMLVCRTLRANTNAFHSNWFDVMMHAVDGRSLQYVCIQLNVNLQRWTFCHGLSVTFILTLCIHKT